ncbi:MAG: 7,8-dihydro-8-oxoguanine triphosphatase [Parcubacteria group bacterium Gr01-1014_3]|nr:MAG: 7,8-dihydro-8-oxoguanine triphosphatase [Parcubacteria group bacterium Gr01-1014_3]
MRKILTLCVVHQHPRVLLGMKKRGFGAGRWNGFGGKVQAGETIEDGAKRELLEEAGITVNKMEKVGLMDFEFQGNPEILEVHIFRAEDFAGQPSESEEMKPAWYHVNEMPYDKMWPDDIHWFPLFLAGKKFQGKILFGEADKILEMEIKEVGSLV